MENSEKNTEVTFTGAEREDFESKIQELLKKHGLDLKEVEYKKSDYSKSMLFHIDLNDANTNVERMRQVESEFRQYVSNYDGYLPEEFSVVDGQYDNDWGIEIIKLSKEKS